MLLQEMIDAGLVAMIKVAGIGLVEKRLGKTLTGKQSNAKLVQLLYNILGPRHGWIAYLWQRI